MRIIRPWAAEGNFTEVLVPEPEDWTELLELLETRPLSIDERVEATMRYMRAKIEESKNEE